MWTVPTGLTTGTGDLVHGKATTAAARAGDVNAASIHVEPVAPRRRSISYAAGRWPVGILDDRLVLF